MIYKKNNKKNLNLFDNKNKIKNNYNPNPKIMYDFLSDHLESNILTVHNYMNIFIHKM